MGSLLQLPKAFGPLCICTLGEPTLQRSTGPGLCRQKLPSEMQLGWPRKLLCSLT